MTKEPAKAQNDFPDWALVKAKRKNDRLMAAVLKAVQTEETKPENVTATSLMPQTTFREVIADINEVHAAVRKNAFGRPKSGKTIVTLRLDPDVISALKAKGAGWQPRANALLRKALGL